jgi:hypothetical protein
MSWISRSELFLEEARNPSGTILLAIRASVLIVLLRKSESSSIPSEFTILVGREIGAKIFLRSILTPTYTI